MHWLNDHGGYASWLQVVLMVVFFGLQLLFKKIDEDGHDRFSKKGNSQAWATGQSKEILSPISEVGLVFKKSQTIAPLLILKKT